MMLSLVIPANPFILNGMLMIPEVPVIHVVEPIVVASLVRMLPAAW